MRVTLERHDILLRDHAGYYRTTLADSHIASSLLLRSVAFPDSTSGSDQVWLTYNRQGQRLTLTDQNGTVHSDNYDLLARPTQDRVTKLASGVDGAIRRIETAYEVRGMVNRVSSLDSASVGLGSVVNEVRWSYNDFSQSIQTYQSHSGAVNTSTTPSVQQTYADGSANTIRPTSLLYPNGRTLAYNYGTAGGIDDSVSRISNYFSGVYLAFYRYLGLGTVVQQDSTQASLQYTLVSPTNTIDPDTGDIYAGLDRFGRVKDCRWRNTATGDDLSRVQYGYNRASSRTWRANPTDPDQHYDWLYGYDGLQRVTSGKRGTLNGTQTGLTDAQFGQCWTLDSTGNWQWFRRDVYAQHNTVFYISSIPPGNQIWIENPDFTHFPYDQRSPGEVRSNVFVARKYTIVSLYLRPAAPLEDYQKNMICT